MEKLGPSDLGPNVNVGGASCPKRVWFVGKDKRFRIACNTLDTVYSEYEFNNWVLNGRDEQSAMEIKERWERAVFEHRERFLLRCKRGAVWIFVRFNAIRSVELEGDIAQWELGGRDYIGALDIRDKYEKIDHEEPSSASVSRDPLTKWFVNLSEGFRIRCDAFTDIFPEEDFDRWKNLGGKRKRLCDLRIFGRRGNGPYF